MSLGKNSCFWLGSNGFNPHDFHESAGPFGVNGKSSATKKIRHLPTPFGRMAQMLLVDDSHQLQVLIALNTRFEIDVGSMEPQQFTLFSDADFGTIQIDPRSLLIHRLGPLFF